MVVRAVLLQEGRHAARVAAGHAQPGPRHVHGLRHHVCRARAPARDGARVADAYQPAELGVADLRRGGHAGDPEEEGLGVVCLAAVPLDVQLPELRRGEGEGAGELDPGLAPLLHAARPRQAHQLQTARTFGFHIRYR